MERPRSDAATYRRAVAPLEGRNTADAASLRGGGSRLFGACLDGPGILALGLDVAIDQLDDCTRRRIAVKEAGLHHAGIAAVALLVARAEHLEELLDHRQIAHLRERVAAGMHVAALARRPAVRPD